MIHKIAFNPIPWYFYPDGWHPERAPSLSHILEAIKSAGYDYVHAEIPEGGTPKEYMQLLAEKGLAPAPGYFSASYSDLNQLEQTIEAARKIAGAHAELGLNRILLAEKVGAAQSRLQQPAQAVEASASRLNLIIDGIGKVSEAMKSEGVLPCLHQHVASWIESEEETVAVLEAIPSNLLLFGPDTGHLTWAGADPAVLICRYKNRIGAVHIKDMRKSVAASVAADGVDYQAACSRHIWTEPGRGDLDFDKIFKALDGYDGWYIVEVDIKDQPTVEESASISNAWLVKQLE